MIPRLVFSLFSLGIFMCMPASGIAFTTIEHRVATPYEPLALSGTILTEKFLLGELQGNPHMYEFAVGEETPVRFVLAQKDTPNLLPFSFILVRVNDGNRGVEEVGRMSAGTTPWEPYSETALGISLVQLEPFTAQLTPGIYRVEISTAINQGKYALFSGTIPTQSGFFATLSEVRAVQRFFDTSFLAMLFISSIYIPLAFTVLLIAFYLTRRYHLTLQNHA